MKDSQTGPVKPLGAGTRSIPDHTWTSLETSLLQSERTLPFTLDSTFLNLSGSIRYTCRTKLTDSRQRNMSRK